MNRRTSLNQAIEVAYPEFGNGNWSIGDDELAEIVEKTLTSSSVPIDQLPYLAEAICLDNFNRSDFSECLENYLQHQGSRIAADERTKIDAIDNLCQDARTHGPGKESKRLEELLVGTQFTRPIIDTPDGCKLSNAKNTSTARRVGDVVFLPPKAEIFVIGDTHGDAESTQQIISEITSCGAMDRGAFVVFLGDYSNNGVKSWQNLLTILEWQRTNPNSVVLLSGNHEYKESYQTALNEYLNVHWDRFNADQLPAQLQDRLPRFDNHYGHLRFDLIRTFGYREGERLYDRCAAWGNSLPYICVSGDLMISHSLGRPTHRDVSLPELLNAKHSDRDNLTQLGYEIWSSRRNTLHSLMVNNREITENLVKAFCELLGVNQFVVGHCHYRSGDSVRFGSATVSTIVSSAPFSTDSGHYMYQQLLVERHRKRQEENLSSGDGVAGYLHFNVENSQQRSMKLMSI